MLLAGLNERWQRYGERKLAQLSEIERRDAYAFDDWFVRRRGWLWLVWVFGFATLLAAIAAQFPWNLRFGPAAVMFNAVAFSLLWAAFIAWFGYRRLQGKLLRAYGGAMLTGAIVAPIVLTAMDVILGRDLFAWATDPSVLRNLTVLLFVFMFVYVGLVALIATLRNREHAALTSQLEAEARRSDLSRRLAESELKLLQSQVEPHFLFNTLGSAQQLAEKGAPDAARLIADLIRFLRAATPSLRREATTLGDELRMAAAYLAIVRTRLGPRLEFRVDVDAQLSAIPLPPGILITLVENAVKHGIEPTPGGATITLSARLVDGPLPDDAAGGSSPGTAGQGRPGTRRSTGRCIELVVADTGAGLGSGTPGQGIGLANIRERIALLYGDRATLELEENVPRGFVARLIVPVETRPFDTVCMPASRPGPGAAHRAGAEALPLPLALALAGCRDLPDARGASRAQAGMATHPAPVPDLRYSPPPTPARRQESP
jgi:signal transduction histidine kinase